MSQKFFVRSLKQPKKFFGPFNHDQLRTLAQKGRLKQEHEVSRNRVKWVPSTQISPSLFGDDRPAKLQDSASSVRGDGNETSQTFEIRTEVPAPPESVPQESDPWENDLFQADDLVDQKPMSNAVEVSTEGDANAETSPSEKITIGTLEKDAAARRGDLTVVKEYVPSGRCGKPWMMAPLAALAPILCYTGMAIGTLFGVGLAILISLIMTAVTPFEAGVIALVAMVFVAMFALMGQAIGFLLILRLFNRLSHNRSVLMAVGFGIVASLVVLIPALFTSPESASSLTPEQHEITSAVYWIFIGMWTLLFIGITHETLSELKLPYCETCFSFLKISHSRRYPMKSSKIMKLAEQGAVGPLLNMRKSAEDATDYSQVTLQACNKRCCNYLKIVYFWEEENVKENEIPQRSRIKTEGFLNRRRAKIWRKILTPEKPDWFKRIRRWFEF